MANCGEVVAAAGVVRKSARTAAMMFVAAVCEVEFRVVCTPTGINPKTAMRQKAETPKARTSSTRENAAAMAISTRLGRNGLDVAARPASQEGEGDALVTRLFWQTKTCAYFRRDGGGVSTFCGEAPPLHWPRNLIILRSSPHRSNLEWLIVMADKPGLRRW
jgi:hypothetical protein